MVHTPDSPSMLGELSAEEWWRLNTALAHYEVHVIEEGKTISAFAHLICQALASAALQNLTASQICDLLKDEFGGRWVLGEVNAALQELEKAEYVVKLPDPGGERFSVKEPYRTESIREQNEAEQLRSRVLEQWAVELRERHPDLSDDELQLILQDLIQFCIAIFDRRGAECVALIYSGEPRREEFLKLLEAEDLPSLAARPAEIAAVRDAELLNFFRNSAEERSRYIGQFLRSSFLKSAITIDPKFAGVLSKQFGGSTVVLDTNFLFSLFGLRGEFEQEVARAAIRFTTELGIRPLVHRVSIREFRRALESKERLLESFPMPSQELASAMADSLTLEGSLGAYYKRYAVTGVGWDDWVQPFLAIEAGLSELNIEVTDMYQDEIEADVRLVEEANRIYETSHDYYERIWGRLLTDEICRHDAFLRLFVVRLRKGKPEEFVQAKAWCITRDSKLPRYERIERHRPGDVPVFILVEHWMQFVGPIIPRTEDWDALARSLLLSPFLRARIGESASIEKIHRAASRIAEYRNYSAQLAMRVLLNSRFQEAVKTMPEAEFEEEVKAVLEESLLDEYYKQEQQLSLAITEKDDLQSQVTKLSETEKGLHKALEVLHSKLENLRTGVNRAAAIVIGAVILLFGLSLDWGELGPLSLGFAVAGVLVGVLAIISFLRSWRLAWSILIVASAFASLVAAIVSLRFFS